MDRDYKPQDPLVIEGGIYVTDDGELRVGGLKWDLIEAVSEHFGDAGERRLDGHFIMNCARITIEDTWSYQALARENDDARLLEAVAEVNARLPAVLAELARRRKVP